MKKLSFRLDVQGMPEESQPLQPRGGVAGEQGRVPGTRHRAFGKGTRTWAGWAGSLHTH